MTRRRHRVVEQRGETILRLLLALGAVLIVAGSVLALRQGGAPQSQSVTVLSGLLTVFGGAVVGAATSIVVARIADSSTLEEVRDLIVTNTASRFFSNEADLSPIRKTWYHYHMTVMEGTCVWRHRKYHFEKSGGLGTLSTEIEVLDPAGGSHKYSIEAGVRGGRLVLLQRRLEGHEEVVVQVYPDMLAGFRSVHCGISFLQDWDSNHLVTRAILSRDPLIRDLPEGSVPDDVAAALTNAWDADFRRLNRVTFDSLAEDTSGQGEGRAHHQDAGVGPQPRAPRQK